MTTNNADISYADEVFQEKAPELVNHLYVKIVNAGQAAKLDELQSKKLASQVVQEMIEDFGGEVIYIPKGILIPLSGRDLAIWREFNGKNHNELARKYDVSVAWVYKIVKRVQKEEVAKRQMDMFAE